eukprot:SAG31_NODE_1874_length_7020_cov_57.579541_4_plen_52_part_00
MYDPMRGGVLSTLMSPESECDCCTVIGTFITYHRSELSLTSQGLCSSDATS